MAKQQSKTDNTLKTIGFHFQYLIALECCLNSKRGDTICIEQYGDVSNNDEIIEVKHHIDEKYKLSDRHEDFWKTLKNWVENYQISNQYTKLVLLTTAVVDENSSFWGWNELSKNEKYGKIQAIVTAKTTETIKPFVDVIFSFNNEYTQTHLIEILDKFYLKHSHIGIKDKIEDLSQHDKLSIIKEKINKRTFLFDLLGKIASWGIENGSFIWEISVNDFMSYFEFQGPNYVDKPLPFPQLTKDNVTITAYSDYLFIKEIERIKLYDRFKVRAVNDYHQSGKILLYLVDQDIEFSEIIENYESEIMDDIFFEKEGFRISYKPNNDLFVHSAQFYIKCMQLPIKSIKRIQTDTITKEFQQGTLHRIVDAGELTWIIEEPEYV